MAIDGVRSTSDQAADKVYQAADWGENPMGKGYENCPSVCRAGMDYVGGLTQRVGEFVKRDAWITVAGAFVVGYLVAQLLSRERLLRQT